MPQAAVCAPLLAQFAGFFGIGQGDPMRLLAALGPLAIYLLVLGGINLSRRPWLTTGVRDTLALGIAVSGLILVGPVELLLPRELFLRFGIWAWLAWLTFYGVVLALLSLVQLPRLTIYNLPVEESQPLLEHVLTTLDPHARWAGDCASLPGLNVQFQVENFGAMRNVTLTAAGERQSYQGWKMLERALRQALAGRESPINPRGVSLVLVGLVMAVGLAVRWVSDPQDFTRSFLEMLKL